jgi:hypothetical protein|tara:strand:+ start:11269 stop:11676 length:408 start_codon:yes stop_codon:yes gene_type:complete
MKNKKEIHKVLKNSLNLTFSIRALSPTPEQIEKSLFVEALETMVEIQDRTEFMISELGIDTISYEDKYYRVIENLFKINFNQQQLSLIQMYLYELIIDKEWDGTIELDIKEDEEPKVVPFKKATEVWNVINLFKD